MKELREYQSSGIESSNSRLAEGINKQLLVMATGLGKTFVATKLMQQYPGRKLWLTHREELIEQSAMAILREEDFFTQHHMKSIQDEDGLINAMRKGSGLFSGIRELMDHIGIVKQDLFQINGNITVASVQTMVRRLDKIDPNHYDLLIVDEAHLAASKSFTKVIEYFNTRLRLGLTATPHRLDGLSLMNLFDETVAEYDIKFGIDNEYLCQLDAYRIRTELSLDEVKTMGNDLNVSQLDKVIDTPMRNRKVVNAYLQYALGRKGIMFCNTVKHAMNLSEMFNEMGVPATFVVGDEALCPNRKERISLYESGEIQVITSVDIMTTGVDIPETSCIGMVRPTKSRTLYMQSIGRGTRLKTGKYKDCVILDIVDNTQKHSLINTITLDEHKKFEDKIFLTKEKKEKLIQERNRKLEHTLKVDEKVNLLPLPIVSLKHTAEMKGELTEPQMQTLINLGFNVSEDKFTKGHAFELISNSPASSKQVWRVKQLGYDISAGVTIGQANKIFKDLEKKAALTVTVNNHPFIGLT